MSYNKWEKIRAGAVRKGKEDSKERELPASYWEKLRGRGRRVRDVAAGSDATEIPGNMQGTGNSVEYGKQAYGENTGTRING